MRAVECDTHHSLTAQKEPLISEMRQLSGKYDALADRLREFRDRLHEHTAKTRPATAPSGVWDQGQQEGQARGRRLARNSPLSAQTRRFFASPKALTLPVGVDAQDWSSDE